MKIIKRDNFDRESISDTSIAENVNEYYGKFIVEKLNRSFSGDYAQDYFALEEDNYKLYEFKP